MGICPSDQDRHVLRHLHSGLPITARSQLRSNVPDCLPIFCHCDSLPQALSSNICWYFAISFLHESIKRHNFCLQHSTANTATMHKNTTRWAHHIALSSMDNLSNTYRFSKPSSLFAFKLHENLQHIFQINMSQM